MQRTWFALLPVSVALLLAGEQTWKTKKIAEWSEDDAKQVLTESPWAKSVTPKFNRSSSGPREGGRGGGMGRRGGIGLGGIGIGGGGIGMGGPGMGRDGGWGGAGGGRNRGGMGQPPDQGGSGPERRTPPNLTVRWESAVPVQNAEMKMKESGGPYGDDSHYAIAVLGFPGRMADQGDRLKPKGELKIEGKKTIKASDTKVLSRENGVMVVFLFPRSKEISPKDKQVEFNAQVGPMELKQVFELSEMTYEGKLEI